MRISTYFSALLAASLVSLLGCGKPASPTTTHPNTQPTMSYILDICGDRQISSPTEDQIRDAVMKLDTKKGDAFLVLGLANDESTYIQTSGDQRIGFDLEHQKGSLKDHYRAEGEFTAEKIVEALISYMSGTEHWRTGKNWTRIDL
jgi:hypothetical protein